MEHGRFTTRALTDPPQANRDETDVRQLRCAVCQRRLGSSVIFLEETGDVPAPRQSWMLCASCDAAVKERLAASPVQSPVRLRVAVGIVATERAPAARRARYWEPSDQAWGRIFLWLFLITMLVHLAVIVAVAGIPH